MTHSPLNPSIDRLAVVDALRGFALLAIVLLHNLEHYNLFFIPLDMPSWLNTLDKGVWQTIFLLLAGKAYATFSLLFGFSFYIQFRNACARGQNFRARFAWRMLLLALFAQLHALFYNGDILLLYAVVGLVLIPMVHLKDRTVLIVAAICLLQPVEIAKIIYAYCNPDFGFSGNWFMKYADMAHPVMQYGTFAENLKTNIVIGQLYSNLWQVEFGRLLQTAGLFMLGMLLGRRNFFIKSENSIETWKTILVVSAITLLPMYAIKNFVPPLMDNITARAALELVTYSLTNFVFMSFLVSGFTLLWFRKNGGYKFQRVMVPYGRMTLTNYITQSIMGVCIYYGFGLGLYQYTGATATTLIALCIIGAQWWWSRAWLERHRQGPLEYLWKRGTWIANKRK